MGLVCSETVRIFIQGIFRERSVQVEVDAHEPQSQLQEALKERTKVVSGNIQGTFREHSRNIQGTFREHSGNIQENFREHSGNIQCELRWTPVGLYTNCKKHLKKVPKVAAGYNLPTWVPKTSVDMIK
jgi:antitoxin component of RelBE/YafQ-DinJ toxin-antitoxin module